MSRRQQVVDLLAAGHPTFDDDEIAVRLGMNRHYVNQICRKLAGDGVVERHFGHDSKYVNRLVRSDYVPAVADPAALTAPSENLVGWCAEQDTGRKFWWGDWNRVIRDVITAQRTGEPVHYDDDE